MKRNAFCTTLLVALAACGGSEPAADAGDSAPAAQPAAQPAASDELQMPDWYQYDEASNTVTLDIVAGQTNKANYWNYNGFIASDGVTIVVPVGATVTIEFSNEDPSLTHSVGIAAFTASPPAQLTGDPVFDGAISNNATDMMAATATGQSEEITFTADQAGEYSLACYVPGHAVAGMWLPFNVSDAGEAGVRGLPM